MGLEKLIGVGYGPSFLRVRKGALGKIGVSRLQRRANGIETDAVAVELIRIGFHTYRRAGAPPDLHLSYSLDLRELLRQDRIGSIVNFGGGDILRCESKNQNG